MGKFQKKIENLMSAITFAEVGEFETAKGFLQEDRRVLFATKDGQEDKQAFTYAVNICKRIGANLDILFVSSKMTLTPLIEGFIKELKKEGISHSVSQKEGCLKNQIVDYTNEKKGILFVVVESSKNLDSNCRRNGINFSQALKKLSCPLVVVSELENSLT